MPGLFMSGLRRKLQPDDVAGLWDVGHDQGASLPTGSPKSASPWTFSAVVQVADWNNDDPTVFLADVDRRIEVEARRLHDGRRDAHGRAVALIVTRIADLQSTLWDQHSSGRRLCKQCRYAHNEIYVLSQNLDLNSSVNDGTFPGQSGGVKPSHGDGSCDA